MSVPIRRCPECGSADLSAAEVAGGGAKRFKPMCLKCKYVAKVGSESLEKAADDNFTALMLWDKGEHGGGVWEPMPAQVNLQKGDEKKPSVGQILLDMPVAVDNSAGAVFRPEEEQARFEKGEPVPKTWTCVQCARQEQGSIIAGAVTGEDFYVMPAGWPMKYPSAEMFCSVLCTQAHKADVRSGQKVSA